MTRSIFWKITVPIILVVIVCMSVLAYFLTNSIKETLHNDLRANMIDEASLATEYILTGFIESRESEYFEEAAKALGERIDARITFIDSDGNVKGDSWEDPAEMDNHANRPEVKTALSGEIGESSRYSMTVGQNMLYIAVPIIYQNEIMGVTRVEIPLTEVENYTGTVNRNIALALVIIALLVILAAISITRTITRPVREVTRAAVKIAGGKLDQQIEIRSNDELGRLGQAFNKMSVKLNQQMMAISDERSKLVTVLANITDGIILTDEQTNIVLSNTAAEKLFGFKETDVLGKPLIESVINHEIDDVLRKCLKTESIQNTQIDSKNTRFLRVIAVPLKTNTGKGALLNIQDLTEIRTLQTMRREFLGNVSHELRTPLTSIKAIVETLQNGAINDSAVAHNFLDQVDSEVDSITQMINELIELTRIETGKVELKMRPMDLNSLIREITARLIPQAERKQIKLNTELTENLPEVQADRDRIQQVLTNIIYNAIKFTPNSGEITINSRPGDKEIIVEIKDTGIGISKEDLAHIFERFYKADKSRSDEGTGLGLAISKHIIQAHKGRIWVNSRENEGSTFGFSLPA